jgi:hypothetical protein
VLTLNLSKDCKFNKTEYFLLGGLRLRSGHLTKNTPGYLIHDPQQEISSNELPRVGRSICRMNALHLRKMWMQMLHPRIGVQSFPEIS